MILIACPTCDRQYDVTHVLVGERVRCLCDAVIEVGQQRSMQVRAMHCCAPSIRIAVRGQTYELAESEHRRFPLG